MNTAFPALAATRSDIRVIHHGLTPAASRGGRAELMPDHPHVVRLESRPANQEGRGQITIRDLIKQALRMRPTRIVLGEARGAEIMDLFSALNTGHEGS